MELNNNIEKQIREKLNAREIEPSSQAWDRLDAMLSVAEEKKTKRSFGWLYIAASILVFVSVGTFLYNQDDTQIKSTETVVGVDSDANTVKQNADSVAEEANSDSNGTKVSPSETSVKSTIASKKSIIAQNEKHSNPSDDGQINNQKTNNTPLINKEKVINFQKNNDVAVKNLANPDASKEINKEVQVFKSNNVNPETLASVDEKAPKTDNSSKVKVNANSLLSEVDGELELTFREKVFKKVNKNYKEVKVALANRNNQQ